MKSHAELSESAKTLTLTPCIALTETKSSASFSTRNTVPSTSSLSLPTPSALTSSPRLLARRDRPMSCPSILLPRSTADERGGELPARLWLWLSHAKLMNNRRIFGSPSSSA